VFCHTSIQESIQVPLLDKPFVVVIVASTGSMTVTGISTEGVVESRLIVTSSEYDGLATRVVRIKIIMTDKNLDIWMTIPSGTRRQYLQDIIQDSNIPPEKIVIVHTVESEPIEGVNNIYDLEPVNIHRWWNRGIDVARTFGADYIAVLNDDLILKNDPINKIAQQMNRTKAVLGYPVPNIGLGYCWVLDIKSNIRADETFRWWYGDDDIRMKAALQGEIVYVPVEVQHLHPNHLTSNNEELMKLTKADQTYFEEKWNTLL